MQIVYNRPFVTTYQEAILDAPERYTITAAATKCGKTASHIIWMFEQALKLKETDFELAIECRKDTKKCGKDAKYFILK